MARRLLMFDSASEYILRHDDPCRFYYWPIIGRLYRRRLEICLDLLPGGGKVLEIGFGSGISFPSLGQLYSEIHGADLHSDCPSVTSCFTQRGIQVNLVNASVMDLPYADD